MLVASISLDDFLQDALTIHITSVEQVEENLWNRSIRIMARTAVEKSDMG